MPSFSTARSTTIAADPAVVHALIEDFRAWRKWSPWEDLDPDLKRTYSGPERGVGSRYEWSGNKKAGQGSMEIVESDPPGSGPGRVVIDLEFLKPFKARNTTRYDLKPTGAGTDVTWTMSGERNVLMAVAGALFFDKAIGKDFEKGLARLKAAAEVT
ncbi:transcriptional regulator [Nocardioides gansuensis]|uniref:Transcriptional regulator n=1 Tax=Nocardioides gansuensis TaxID=2138300 RepID=A0A2T8F6S4_9ACTN|nr:SRPBCC family protein [Nocardioides gansuensis]PVG81410.1 transcriptional regulator [Nocardioides gansuensis]